MGGRVIYLAARQRVSCLDRSGGEQAANARLCNHTNAGQPGGREQADGGSRKPRPAAISLLPRAAWLPRRSTPLPATVGSVRTARPNPSNPTCPKRMTASAPARQGVAGIDPACARGPGRPRPSTATRMDCKCWRRRLLGMHRNAVDSGPIDRRKVQVRAASRARMRPAASVTRVSSLFSAGPARRSTQAYPRHVP